MATKPIVSVLLPVFNAAAYVEESVRSILTQTLCDFEQMCIRDSPTHLSIAYVSRDGQPKRACCSRETSRPIALRTG